MGTPGRRPRTHDAPRAERTATILVVDDQLAIRRYIAAQLEKLGYAAMAAANGREALEILRGDTDIDLMMTDVVMPGMDGYVLARKAQAVRPGLKILMCTGSWADPRFPGRDHPDLPVLGKPYRLEELARRLEELLDGAKG